MRPIADAQPDPVARARVVAMCADTAIGAVPALMDGNAALMAIASSPRKH